MVLPIKVILTEKIRKAFFPKRYIGLELLVQYEIDEELKLKISHGQLTGLKTLLDEIEKRYGDIKKPQINFTNEGERVKFEEKKVYINLPAWLGFMYAINDISNQYFIEKYHRDFKKECRMKGLKEYLEGNPPSNIIQHIQNSNFEIIENILSKFDNLQDSEKKIIQENFEHSQVGTNILKKYGKLAKNSPKLQVKSVVMNINKIKEPEAKELTMALMKSKHADLFTDQIAKFPKEIQVKMLKNINKMVELLLFQEKLESSLKKFKILVKTHKDASTKNEKEIHAFLAKHYWLLGPEYYGSGIKSDINSKGKKTSETYVKPWRIYPDFLIEKIDQTTDSCTVIELEEANDKIFNKDKTLSKEALDGLYQAISYHIYFNVEKNKSTKGIAILGFTGPLDTIQKEKLRRLNDLFPKVEIKTYDQLIKDAERLLDFIKNYTSKEK
ncbi:MAG: DUF4263 domain-containing protein [Clostridia bacterium]|nr:DUF4263 domain-containing protein [Clostridia bacterium]